MYNKHLAFVDANKKYTLDDLAAYIMQQEGNCATWREAMEFAKEAYQEVCFDGIHKLGRKALNLALFEYIGEPW